MRRPSREKLFLYLVNPIAGALVVNELMAKNGIDDYMARTIGIIVTVIGQYAAGRFLIRSKENITRDAAVRATIDHQIISNQLPDPDTIYHSN